MNIHLLKEYIDLYKSQFANINQKEIYKWKAVKCFQDNWDIDSKNFLLMFKSAFRDTVNLLQSGQYFPLGMMILYSEKQPEQVRKLFLDLYKEEKDIYDRISTFQKGIGTINDRLFPGKNTYQDHRAIIVYLTLRYPEIYYLYKFGMYKDFSKKFKLSYLPKAGKIENIGHYNSLCNLIRHNISKDQALLKLHKNRITDDCYFDENLHLLTQDFIYAVTKHLKLISKPQEVFIPSTITTSENLDASDIIINDQNINLNGRFVNFIENMTEAKRIGDLGEMWVIKQEEKKLNNKRLSLHAMKIKHISKDKGDGTGYDIESYDLDGNKIFIEVKTTKNDFSSTFYITRNEFELSKKEKLNYYLYRVYNYNEITQDADCLIIRGDLTNLCNFPMQYKASIKKWK